MVAAPRLASVLALALLAGLPATAGAAQKVPTVPPPLTNAAAPPGTAFDGDGMRIWYVNQSNGGNVRSIANRAKAAGIETLFIKAGDGRNAWSQSNRSLVNKLHSYGLHVCAWQYVYGRYPATEAKIGAYAKKAGAECFVIDAEAEVEGRYAAASTYMRKLRAGLGADYPVGVAPFPYVDYHPGYPYSVFLGPGGAQFNVPQMYWKAIGTTVRGVYEHTYIFNRVWERPIYPIGQTYGNPGRTQIKLFRRFGINYGGLAPSWWSWQETNLREWGALGAQTAGPVVGYRPVTSHPLLKRGSK